MGGRRWLAGFRSLDDRDDEVAVRGFLRRPVLAPARVPNDVRLAYYYQAFAKWYATDGSITENGRLVQKMNCIANNRTDCLGPDRSVRLEGAAPTLSRRELAGSVYSANGGQQVGLDLDEDVLVAGAGVPSSTLSTWGGGDAFGRAMFDNLSSSGFRPYWSVRPVSRRR